MGRRHRRITCDDCPLRQHQPDDDGAECACLHHGDGSRTRATDPGLGRLATEENAFAVARRTHLPIGIIINVLHAIDAVILERDVHRRG